MHQFLQHMEIEESDYTTEEFTDIVALLNELATNTIHNLSGTSWIEQKEAFEKNNKKYLILVDINFEKEGLPSNHGETIIKDILSRR